MKVPLFFPKETLFYILSGILTAAVNDMIFTLFYTVFSGRGSQWHRLCVRGAFFVF